VNGYPLKRQELKDEFEESVVSAILRQTGELQKAVYNVSIFCFLLFSYSTNCTVLCFDTDGCVAWRTSGLSRAPFH